MRILTFTRSSLGALALVLILLGCAPTSAPPASTRPSDAEPPRREPKSLTIASPTEPGNIALPTMGDIPTGAAGGGDIKLALHHRLVTYDDRGDLHPMLATEIPSQQNGGWIIRPDGTMQTTYRLRPNVTWHDGTPLTAQDLVFAWTVTSDIEIPLSGRTGSLIRQINTPDDYTLVYEWSSTYPLANALTHDELAPLPRHLIESAYRTDKERFQQLGYWTHDFVGTGPYRMARWEPGSHMELRAYDGFYGGRAKIDTLVFRFMTDESTVVANLLSGAIDGSMARAVDFSSAVFVKEEWERAGKKPLFVAQTTHWRLLEIQLRPELVRPTELLDVRVRRALLYALDRQALADAMLAGQAPMSLTFIAPDDAKWDWVKDVVDPHDYDPRRAQALLTEVGWQRGSDGLFVHGGGEPATIPIVARPDPTTPREIAIIADSWKSAGIGSEQSIYTPGQARDSKIGASFPGAFVGQNPLTTDNTLTIVYGGLCPSDANRWSGRNHGCYLNPQWDRIADGLKTAIDPNEQRRLWRDLVKLTLDDLPVLPMYFNVWPLIFREGVVGVRGDTRPRTASTWNAQDWDVVS